MGVGFVANLDRLVSIAGVCGDRIDRMHAMQVGAAVTDLSDRVRWRLVGDMGGTY
jgi:hypothetical protein